MAWMVKVTNLIWDKRYDKGRKAVECQQALANKLDQRRHLRDDDRRKHEEAAADIWLDPEHSESDESENSADRTDTSMSN